MQKAKFIAVKWARGERGYVDLRNPVDGQIYTVVAKGLPRWLFDRMGIINRNGEKIGSAQISHQDTPILPQNPKQDA